MSVVKTQMNASHTFLKSQGRKLAKWLVVLSHEITQGLHEVLFIITVILL